MTRFKYGAFEEIKEDPTRCVEVVYGGFGRWSSFHPFQCSRKRGFGLMGLYCKQHAKRHPVISLGNEALKGEKE